MRCIYITIFILLFNFSAWSKTPEEDCSLSDNKVAKDINDNVSNNKFVSAYKLLKENFKESSDDKTKSCYYKKRNSELKDLVKKQLEDSKKKIETFLKDKNYTAISSELLELVNQGAESINESFVADFLNKYQTPEVCEAGLFRLCYNGVRWGTKVDYSISKKLGCIRKTKTADNTINLNLFKSEEEENRENLLSKVNAEKHQILLPTDSRTMEEAKNINDEYIKSLTDGHALLSISRSLILSGAFCSGIILGDRLVGAYGYMPFSGTNEDERKDEYLYLKATMKKEYGKDVKEELFSFAQWTNSNGVNVLLVTQPHAKSMYVRYVSIDAINDAQKINAKAISEALKNL